ncbi:hypothetical protein PAPYR_2745 [Paratrimastix pyriformis]|uniref:F-box domain-containing protein n=1 Tax=Paratrimastix pyriformis TaxID=342808 RepID=A0ABQ8UNZ1_9EUKA|nr:hypothetical protein PAPYR_2745 [Paratrimastix pyriformis]
MCRPGTGDTAHNGITGVSRLFPHFFGVMESPSPFDGIPSEIIRMIHHHLHTGSALSTGALVSRRWKEALWTDDGLWAEAFEYDFGLDTAFIIEKKLGSTGYWRQKYARRFSVLKKIQSEREFRRNELLNIRRAGLRRDFRKAQLAMTFYGVPCPLQSSPPSSCHHCFIVPLAVYVAFPAFVTLVILKAETALGWSLHAVFAPLDAVLAICFAALLPLAIEVPSRCIETLVGLLLLPATLHWAAARGDGQLLGRWWATPLIVPGGLNWMYIFTPAMAFCLWVYLRLMRYLSTLGGRWVGRLDAYLTAHVPLEVGACLGLLGARLQWGGPWFLYTYTLAPLFVIPLSLVVSACRAPRHRLRRILQLSLHCLPVSAALVMLCLRLDLGLVHTAFLTIPLAFGSARPPPCRPLHHLPVAVLVFFGAWTLFSRGRKPGTFQMGPPEFREVEAALEKKYGRLIYPPRSPDLIYSPTGG